MSFFQPSDLIFYKKDGQIMSGGYSIDSILLKEGISPMTTLNTKTQEGGSNVSSLFENLAVPAGLFFMNQQGSFKKTDFDPENIEEHTALSEDIHDKLFAMVEMNSQKQKNVTKKNKEPLQKKKKTKRNIK